MQRLLGLIAVIMLAWLVLPSSVFAIKADDPEFEQFLKEIKWDKKDYVEYLKSKDWNLSDFDSTDELGIPLTEESVQAVMKKFDLSREELNALLIENGDIEKGEDALDSMYILFDEELAEYVDFYLNGWEGTPIDASNLQELLEYYEFESKEELEKYLNGFDDSISNYDYIEDLDEAVYSYMYGDVYDIDLGIEFISPDLGLTDEEVDKLISHLESLNFENPDFEAKLIELGERMEGIEEFETADDLTAEQTAELLDIYSDLIELFQFQTEFQLVKGDDKKPLSFSDFWTLETTNGYNLLINIYNTKGDFLADILLTADLFDSEIIEEVGEDVKEIEEVIAKAPPKKAEKPKLYETPAKTAVKTVKGAKLPKTATDYIPNALVGLGLIAIGALLFRRFKALGM